MSEVIRAGEITQTYGDVAGEYQAVRRHVGVIDLSSRGRIRVSGTEAVMFLNGLITNDMKTLEVNHWMAAAFPNVQGRLVAAVRVIRLSDDTKGPTFIIDTEKETHDRVLDSIKRFTLAGDFHVTDVTPDTAMLSIQGPQARDVLNTILIGAGQIPKDGSLDVKWHDDHVEVIRASHTSEDGFDFIVASGSATALWTELVSAGARPVGEEALNILRVEAGIGRFGVDMDESNVITETNLDAAVSFTKGCYIGQEIIARIKYRGHVAKKLCGLVLETDDLIERGNSISANEKEIGRITSTVVSPALRKTIALGYLRYEYIAPGTTVNVGDTTATVHELPFVRGSWYEVSENG